MDTQVFLRLFGLSGQYPVLGQLSVLVTNLSGPLFIGLYTIMVAKALFTKRDVVLPLLLGPALSLLGVALVRQVYMRPRPFVALEIESLIEQAASGSFPSRHAVSAFAIAAAGAYAYRRWGRGLLVLAGITGLSRVMVGVHFPLDIIVGAGFGCLCAWCGFQWLGCRQQQLSSTGPEETGAG